MRVLPLTRQLPITSPLEIDHTLADATYDELLEKLAGHKFADIPVALRGNILAYYGSADALPGATSDGQKRSAKSRLQLALLKSTLPDGDAAGLVDR